MSRCPENDCEEHFDNINELKVHSSYHVYHNKLKELGKRRLEFLNSKFHADMNCPFAVSVEANFPQVPTKLVCEWIGCGLEFLCVEKFYEHVSNHAHRLVDKCYWSVCQKTFKTVTKSLMREHLRTHTLQKLIACPQCGNLFSTKIKFDDHFLRHASLETFQLCEPESIDVQNLVSIETYSIKGQKIKIFRCNQHNCKQQFLSSSLAYEHTRSHSKQYQCDECPFVAKTSNSLQQHILFRHQDLRSFQCPICSKTFKQRGDLRAHVKRHQIVIYKCLKCEFEAHTEESLSKHARLHDNNSDYLCHVCEKIFSRGNNLSRHLIQIHKYSLPEGQSKFKYRLVNGGFHILEIKESDDNNNG